MEVLLSPITVFASFPLLGLGVSLLFVFGLISNKYRSGNKIIFGACAVSWFLFTVLNYYLLYWRSPSGDMAIRVDLVLLGPVMIFVTAVGGILLFKGYGKKEGQ